MEKGYPYNLVLNAYTDFKKDILEVRFVPEYGCEIPKGAKIKLILEAIERKEIILTKNLTGWKTTFCLSNIPSGNYGLRAEIIDSKRRPFPVRVVQQKELIKAQWFGNKKGYRKGVPEPWEPIKVKREGKSLSLICWGRKYEIDNKNVLTQVFSLGTPLLSSPIVLKGRLNGEEICWKFGKIEFEEETEERVIILRRIEGNGLIFKSRLWIEYDGMIRLDWVLESGNEILLDELTMEIPFKAENAKNLHFSPGKWAEPCNNAFFLPEEGFTSDFLPFIWLGNDEKGFSWFSESDINWYNSEKNLIEITKKDDKVLLKLNIINKSLRISPEGQRSDMLRMIPENEPIRSLSYTFGFQATPVKKLFEDAWDHRIIWIDGDSSFWKSPLVPKISALKELKSKGIRTIIMFEYWTGIENYTKPINEIDEKKLKEIIKKAHNLGLKVLFYFGFLFSDLAPEWECLGEHCLILPKAGYPIGHYSQLPDQSAWHFCRRSLWQDFLVDGIDEVMRKFKIDGVYLDETGILKGCLNLLHGCGYINPDGNLKKTYPIFATRNIMKRIFTVIKKRKPDGIVNFHNSSCMTIPISSWVTSTLDGEQFVRVKPGLFALDILPLESFRCEFMGHQWGVPAEFYCANNIPYKFTEALAFSLIHDVPVRTNRVDTGDLDLLSQLWKVFDKFGKKESKWIPYWKNSEYVEVSPFACYCSIYIHPENGVIGIISNLTRKEQKVMVKFEIEKIGLKGSGDIIDCLKGKKMNFIGDKIIIKLPSLGWKMIWIKTERTTTLCSNEGSSLSF